MAKSFLYRLGAVLSVVCAVGIVWWADLPTAPEFTPILPDDQKIVAPVTGGIAPSFAEATLTGEILQVDTGLGHPLIINFWATWCVPCVAEMPMLNDLFLTGIPILGVNAGLESEMQVQTWITDYNLAFPIIVDDSERTLERLYQIKGLPTTFFIDQNGIIQQIVVGALNSENLTAGLEAIRPTE